MITSPCLQLLVEHLADDDRHQRQRSNTVLGQHRHQVGRQYKVVQVQRAALSDRLPNLAEPVVKVEREHTSNPLVLSSAKILGDDIGAVGEVAMPYQNPLGPAGIPDE